MRDARRVEIAAAIPALAAKVQKRARGYADVLDKQENLRFRLCLVERIQADERSAVMKYALVLMTITGIVAYFLGEMSGKLQCVAEWVQP